MKRLNAVGPEIRKLRVQRGWSQETLAAKLQIQGWDLSRSGVAKLETQRIRVSDIHLLRLAEVFSVGISELASRIQRSAGASGLAGYLAVEGCGQAKITQHWQTARATPRSEPRPDREVQCH